MGTGDKIRLALVGIGTWSQVIADGIKRSGEVELVSCYTRSPEARRRFADTYGCDQDDSFEKVLQRKDIDALYLTTPNSFHAEQTVLAASCGKHVMVDKPIANTLEDGAAMIAACRRAGVVLMIGHDIRRLSGNRKLKQLLDEGVMGDPVMAEANFSHELGFHLTPSHFRWRGDDSGCPGGALMSMGIHHADTLGYLLGPVESVFAFFSHLYIPAEVEDVNQAVFRFASGVLGYLGCSYATPKTHWINIYGTKAKASCTVSMPEVPIEDIFKVWSDVDRYTELWLYRAGRGDREKIDLTIGDPIVEQIDEFARCIRSGATPETDGQKGCASLALVRAAIESSRTGCRVPIRSIVG
jgi:predicted dehydrogenase